MFPKCSVMVDLPLSKRVAIASCVAYTGFVLQLHHVGKTATLRQIDHRQRVFRLVGDIFDEEDDEHVVFVLTRIHVKFVQRGAHFKIGHNKTSVHSDAIGRINAFYFICQSLSGKMLQRYKKYAHLQISPKKICRLQHFLCRSTCLHLHKIPKHTKVTRSTIFLCIIG